MERLIDIKDLAKHYISHTLTDFLQTLTDDELEYAIGCILADDLIEDRVYIYEAIKNEIEYRESDKNLASRKK